MSGTSSATSSVATSSVASSCLVAGLVVAATWFLKRELDGLRRELRSLGGNENRKNNRTNNNEQEDTASDPESRERVLLTTEVAGPVSSKRTEVVVGGPDQNHLGIYDPTSANSPTVTSKWGKSIAERRILLEGAFDLTHYGHMNACRLAKTLGGKLVVGVNSSATITTAKVSSVTKPDNP
jgi:cytidyltransferase-like protein